MLTCGTCSSGAIAKAPRPADADARSTTCEPARDPLHPLRVEWPAQNNTALECREPHGLVVVSYAGCTLEVLDACSAEGSWEFVGSPPPHDTLTMRNENDVFAGEPANTIDSTDVLEMEAAGLVLVLERIGAGGTAPPVEERHRVV